MILEREIVFPDLIDYTVRESTGQFIIPLIGMFGIAEYLERNGCRALIDNLGERVVYERTFDVERRLRSDEALVYAIGLH